MNTIQQNLGLIPIRNFGIILPNLYRSAQPEYSYEYEWLNKIGIKKIISLRAESEHDARMVKGLGLDWKVERIPVRDHNPPTIDQIKDYYSMLDFTPTLIHCEHGHGRTSTFSILSKMRRGMSLDEAIQDEKDRFHFALHHTIQENFLRGLTNQSFNV